MAHREIHRSGGYSTVFFPHPVHTLLVLLIVLPIFLLATLPPYWMIFKKSGFSPWLSILALVPLVKWIVLWIVGFSEWKANPVPKP
jgi:uncharacterized membrane protein YhaH (DUF805 family)